MAKEAKAVNLTPPYLPYRTFLNSFANLAQGVPPRIDRSIWKNQPGSVQSQIVGAYKFFSLIDDEGKPADMLRSLVLHRDNPTEEVRGLLNKYYAHIIEKDLSTMTASLINDYFEAAFNVDGETKRKAITFFLQAAKAVGMPLSQFLTGQIKASPATRRKRAAKRGNGDDGQIDDLDEGTPQNSANTRTIELRSGGRLTLTASVDFFALAAEDRNFVFSIIDKLAEYEKGT